jgi:MFS family permease
MYEVYGFIAAFTIQILYFSVWGPLRLTARLRRQIKQFVAERALPIEPSAMARLDQRLRRLRLLNLATAVIGLLLLILMIRYMQRPDWRGNPLALIATGYFMVQLLPTILAVTTASKFHVVLKRSLPQERRKALLQPRGLFDFVSRSAVALAGLAYFLLIAFLAYIQQHPFPGFGGVLANTAGITFVYGAIAVAIYLTLRTMGSSPLQTREERMRSVGFVVRILVYVCIASAGFIAAILALSLLDMRLWEPTFACLSVIVTGLLCGMAMREQTSIPAGTDRTDVALTH